MRDVWPWRFGFGAANPHNNKITVGGVKKLLDRSLWEQGIREKPRSSQGANRYDFKAAHGLRKWFKTRAEQAGMLPMNVEILMDHSMGISDHYGKPGEPDLLKDYLKVVDSLTINSDKKQQDEKINSVIDERLKDRNIEVQAFTQRLSNMEDRLGAMYKEMLRAELTLFHSDMPAKELEDAQTLATKAVYPKFEDSEK